MINKEKMIIIKETIIRLFKEKIINFILSINKIKNIVYLDEKGTKSYTIEKGYLKNFEIDTAKVKSCLISDSLIELKIITVPVVSKSILKNIILNTIKKHSVTIPSDNDVDYAILNKEENKYNILVFIKRFKSREDGKNIDYFSTYHILENLIKDKEFNPDSSFIIKIHKEWFLYYFKDRILKKWSIYYDEDISHIKRKNVYILNLFNNIQDNKNFSEIPEDKINPALTSLNKRIFQKKNKQSFYKILSLIAGAAVFLIVLFLNINIFINKSELKKLNGEKENLKKLYDQEISSRGINEDLYNKYISLINKKSNLNEFFYYLYLTCMDNVEIHRINYNNGKFSVSGFCKDDSKLENSFRKINLWKDISFNFSRTGGEIKFNIDGEFTGDK